MFNFTFSVGGYNPFSAQKGAQENVSLATGPQSNSRKLPPPPNRPLPPGSITEDVKPLSRKRGWTPSNSAVSEPISQPTLTVGWIDTPSRYLEAAAQRRLDEDDIEADLPPSKRRKTLTDSIISTAFSAALIGTAVGMTAYRMWRDRGKPTGQDDSESVEPPPPYEKEEWVDEVPQIQPASLSARTPRRLRNPPRRMPRHRTTPIAIPPSQSVVCNPSSRSVMFQGGENVDDKTELEDQMDWMGEKIRSLIEEGQKALGKEIVVMDDNGSNEDGAVDDGMEGWEELDQVIAGPSSSTSSDFRRPRRRPSNQSNNKLSPSLPTRASLGVSASYSGIPASSLKRSRLAINSAGSQAIATSSSFPDARNIAHTSCQTYSDTQAIKVIYENATNSSDFVSEVGRGFEDEDSRGLAECMANIRKVYKIH